MFILKYLFRNRLNQDEEEFSQTLTELLKSIVELMRHETDSTLLVQGACLKYLPTTIPHLLRVYSGKQLSTILTNLLVTLPAGRLTKQKMMTVNDIVHSPLFLNAECRAILLPRITILVRDLLEAKEEVRNMKFLKIECEKNKMFMLLIKVCVKQRRTSVINIFMLMYFNE